MQAYKCDICENFFTKWKRLAVQGKGYCFLNGTEGGQIDICPSCAEAIQKAIDKCREMGVTRDGTKDS